ncbi:unnamed protein product [Kluyveromyces dobzhanskii CBS 2104]|uniref:WGS project CCBQ000000000 data, contig 00228 n=1 Tax=Kluyveromyces dobzhanskii CBS 2104 TaxID=1427455 RepID=A0A0A8LCH9_9SACH|nr:unnamed protein product [Kluyveromyces dobzhanskii CBS 2104]
MNNLKKQDKLEKKDVQYENDSQSVQDDDQVSQMTPQIAAEKKKFRWRVVDNDSPPEVYNWTLYMSILVFGILGAARGYDEGNVSGSVAQVSFQNQFGLADKTKSASYLANLKSNITSMVQLGSIGGTLIAMYTVEKFGRIKALQGVCVLWIAGAIIQITSKNVGQLYAGRLIEGLAIGQTTTIGPVYLSEVSVKQIRGLTGCLFAGAVYFGIMLAYFANYGTALHVSNTSRLQWVVPTSMKIVLAGLIFVGSFIWCIESPRWLMKMGKDDKAIKNLAKLRNLSETHPFIAGEVADIRHQIIQEKETMSGTGYLDMVKEIIFVKSVRYRFFVIACLVQILGQWSGANAITIYAPELLSLVGVKGVDKLKMTAVLGVVKFVSAYISAFFFIDFLGRKKAAYIGISIQLLTLLYFALFLTIVPQATESDAILTKSQFHASQAAIAALYLSGTGWTMGFNSIQYLLSAEVFPIRIRSFAQSCIMLLHFSNQFGNSKAVPKMLLSMNNFGAFYFFVGVLFISLLWVHFFVPEVTGRSLESMEELFSLPWYMIGTRGPEMCPDNSEVTKLTYRKSSVEYQGRPFTDLEAKPMDERIEFATDSKSIEDS